MKKKNLHEILLSTLNLSVRTMQDLKRLNAKTIGDLLKYDTEQLFWDHWFGRKAIRELNEEVLAPLGLQIKEGIKRKTKSFN